MEQYFFFSLVILRAHYSSLLSFQSVIANGLGHWNLVLFCGLCCYVFNLMMEAYRGCLQLLILQENLFW